MTGREGPFWCPIYTRNMFRRSGVMAIMVYKMVNKLWGSLVSFESRNGGKSLYLRHDLLHHYP